MQRTPHGQQRHEQGDRPTQGAFRDRQKPEEVYLDLKTGNMVYVGAKGRTHFSHLRASIIPVLERQRRIDNVMSVKDNGSDC